MSPYILNLTNHLISKHRYDEFLTKVNLALTHPNLRIRELRASLEVQALQDMKAETLGKIMRELDIGDVMATKDEIFQHVGFSGDCEDMLRELVATCLAFTISERILQTEGHLPCYRRKAA